MRFIIQDGKPYLISGGRAFPVEITEKKEVIIDKENGSMSDKVGHLSIDEVIAKIGYSKKQEEPKENPQESEEESREGKKGKKKPNLS